MIMIISALVPIKLGRHQFCKNYLNFKKVPILIILVRIMRINSKIFLKKALYEYLRIGVEENTLKKQKYNFKLIKYVFLKRVFFNQIFLVKV